MSTSMVHKDILYPSTRPKEIKYPRWFGGSASCGAVLFSHPFDLIKVRMQAVPGGVKNGFLKIGLRIYSIEGIKGLYRGLSAGLTRSITYGATRVAMYEEIKKGISEHGQGPTNIATLACAAGLSGFVGAIFGTPSDIANIRMQTDQILPVKDRRNYRNVLDAWVQMKRREGWRSFKQGLWLNCTRCAIMTSSQLASYDTFKHALQGIYQNHRNSPWIEVCASILASLTATTFCSPMDVIRTKLMSSSADKPSVLAILRNLTRTDGLRWVFRGWVPSFVRLGPQTIATLLFLEQQRRIYRIVQSSSLEISK